MFAASRESLASLRDDLDARRTAGDFGAVAGELFDVADLLGREKSLRVMLADSGQEAGAREAVVRNLLASRLSGTTVEIVAAVARSRWSSDADVVDALEQLAAQAAFTVAEADGSLDRVEDEVFRFGRAVDASPELQLTLTDPSLPVATKAAVVHDLLGGRTAPATQLVLGHLAGHLRGQRADKAVATLSDLAAAQRQRIVADVRSAIPLDSEQERRLAAALSALQGRTVRLNVELDPSVIGGITVTVGGEVVDGTVATRLEQARRALA